MSQFETALFQTGFVSGSVTYSDHYSGDDVNVRIVIQVALGGSDPIEMILDTGAQWCVINPALVEELGLDFDENHTPNMKLVVRGVAFLGRLTRANITIPAEKGEDLIAEATFFVPQLTPGETWRFPNFLGLDGFLNRIRYAVDPADNTFLFGLP